MIYCTECKKTFHNKSNLNRHKKAAHRENLEEEPRKKRSKMEDDRTSEISDFSTDEEEEEENTDVWDYIKSQADANHDGDVLKAYSMELKWYASLDEDEVHKQVMFTRDRYMNGKDAMQFEEALAKAIEKRKHLILRTAEEKDGEGEDEDDDVWDVIVREAKTDHEGDILKAYSDVVTRYENLKKDKVHRQVASTFERYRNGADNMDFDEALTNAIERRKDLILRRAEKTSDSE